MKVEKKPGEVVFVTLKLEKGSGWLTSHRLIICEHEQGHLEGKKTETYRLEDLQNAEIDGQMLRLHFRGNEKAIIKLRITPDSFRLEEAKELIEELSKRRKFFNLPENKELPPFESRCWRMFTEYIDNEQECPCGSGKVAYKCCIPRMPTDHITKWYLRSQGKKAKFSTVDKFISLWIAFVSWSEFESKGETDREIIQWLKRSPFLLETFQELLDDQQFHSALKELRGVPIHRYIKDQQVVIQNIKDLDQVLEYIYVMRCNLFHGHEDLEDDYSISHCFTILNMIFAKIMEKDGQLNGEAGRFLELFDSYSQW